MTSEKPLVGDTAERKGTFLGLPKTKVGWWSVALAGIFLLIIALLSTGVPGKLPGQPRWLGQPILTPICGLSMLACGLAAGVTAVIGAFRHHERAWPLWFSMFIGVGMLLVLVAELFGY